MGEARRRKLTGPFESNATQRPQAVVTDIEEVGKILALEQTHCEQCGAAFPLWPPEVSLAHLHDAHPGMFWPPMAKEWADYQADNDLARRANYVTAYRVKFVFLVLQNRCDLYTKLVEAGVIIAPAQG